MMLQVGRSSDDDEMTTRAGWRNHARPQPNWKRGVFLSKVVLKAAVKAVVSLRLEPGEEPLPG